MASSIWDRYLFEDSIIFESSIALQARPNVYVRQPPTLRHHRSVSWISTTPKRWIPLARGTAQHYSVRYDNDRARIGYFCRDVGFVHGGVVTLNRSTSILLIGISSSLAKGIIIFESSG